MADNWEVGDLALCIKSANNGTTTAGCKYSVLRVIPNVRWNDGDLDTALTLMGVKHTTFCGGSWHGRFVKVTPPKADEFDREVIEHLTGAPVKEKA